MVPDRVSLFLRMAGWALALPMLKHVLSMQALARLMSRRSERARSQSEEASIISLSRRVTRFRPLPGRNNCLERSLLAYRFLSKAGADPRLVVGVKRLRDGVEGHVWVIVDGIPIHDSDLALAQFVPIVEFGPNGAPVRSAGSPPLSLGRATRLGV